MAAKPSGAASVEVAPAVDATQPGAAAAAPCAPSTEAAAPGHGDGHGHGTAGKAGGLFNPGVLSLALGSVGVVFGDIGTSPLYAFQAAMVQAAKDRMTDASILGVVSMALWALFLVVTVKYVLFVMRADNKGEGGVLSLMALAQRANGRRTLFVFTLGVIGAALFYGDSIITPAISVLSAIEGLQDRKAHV